MTSIVPDTIPPDLQVRKPGVWHCAKDICGPDVGESYIWSCVVEETGERFLFTGSAALPDLLAEGRIAYKEEEREDPIVGQFGKVRVADKAVRYGPADLHCSGVEKLGGGAFMRVETFATDGAPGTVPVATSEGTLLMQAPSLGAHASSHQNTGDDEISVTGLSGVLADPQTPGAHDQAATTITSGTLDGDRLPAISATKKGGVPATGTPAGKYLKDDGTWASAGGGTPGDSVVSETGFGQSPAAGTETDYSRKDHTHGTPSDPVPTHAGLTTGIHGVGASTVDSVSARDGAIGTHTGLPNAHHTAFVQADHDALPNPHHATTNDPSSGQKAALAGTSGTPGDANRYVTNADSRNSDARTPTTHGNAQHSSTFVTQAEIDTHNGLAGPHASATSVGGKSIPSGGIADAGTLSTHTGAASPHTGHVVIAGQLGNTAASPDVRGIRETSGPTLLTLGAVADGQFLKRSGSTVVGEVPAGGSNPAWWGKVLGCLGDGNPADVLREMLHNPVHPTPTNITTSIARCAYFRPAAQITVNKIRWFGVGATTGLYHVAVYRVSDGVRMAILDDFNTAAQTWGSGAFSCTLAAGVLYLVAVSVDSTGTTAGVGALSATNGRIGVIPESWPGNLDIDLATPLIDPVGFVDFAVTSGALPTTLPARVLQSAWTGGMPAFFLDNNNA